MNGFARCTVPPIVVNKNKGRPSKNATTNTGSSPNAGGGGDLERGQKTPKRTNDDRDPVGNTMSHPRASSPNHNNGERTWFMNGRRKKSVRFTEMPDEIVGTAEDIDRTSISAPKRCDVCNVHLVGFVWECKVCCGENKKTEEEKKTENGALAATNGEEQTVCQTCEELVGVGRMMAVTEKDRVKNTMLEIGPQSPHESQRTMFNGGAGVSGGDVGNASSGASAAPATTDTAGEETTTPSNKNGFRLCVSCYQMHARLSMSRTRFLEERKRREEENLKKQTISTESMPEENESVISEGQNNSSWLQLAEQLQIHKHDPQNFIRTGLDDQMALEEIIRERATLMVNGEDRLGRILKEATRRMDAAKQNAESENASNCMHQNEEELAPAL